MFIHSAALRRRRIRPNLSYNSLVVVQSMIIYRTSRGVENGVKATWRLLLLQKKAALSVSRDVMMRTGTAIYVPLENLSNVIY